MPDIQRYGVTARWSDAVVHRGVAYFVEVPDDPTADVAGQFAQVFRQMDSRVERVGSSRERLLQVLIYLPNFDDLTEFNTQWEAWMPSGHAPSRACVQAMLAAPGYRVELVVTAAIEETQA
jgi:enamine deaminase RidA (YjgF/YER057c/UK114 family)